MTDRQLGNTGQTSQTPENARHGAVPPPLPKQDTKPTTKSKIPLTAGILTGILVLAAMTAAYFLLGDNGKAAKDAYAEKEREEGYEWYGRERYRYDGEHMTSFDFNGGAEDCTTESQASVSYDSFDDYGNWTSRTFTVSSTRRCGGDEYNALTGQTIPSHSEKSETTTRQIRRITYWDKEY